MDEDHMKIHKVQGYVYKTVLSQTRRTSAIFIANEIQQKGTKEISTGYIRYRGGNSWIEYRLNCNDYGWLWII